MIFSTLFVLKHVSVSDCFCTSIESVASVLYNHTHCYYHHFCFNLCVQSLEVSVVVIVRAYVCHSNSKTNKKDAKIYMYVLCLPV